MQEKNLPLKINNILVLVGAGNISKKILQKFYKNGATIIAVDGGAKYCKKANIIPKAIIGDLDSLKNKKKWKKKTTLIHIKEQETTDFEKCLYMTKAPLTIALGMVGDRLDHSLNAFNILFKYANERKIIIIDKKDMAIGLCNRFSFEIKAGDRISILPFEKIEFESSKGLAFSLNGLEMSQIKNTGISNIATKGAFSIIPKTNKKAYSLIIKNKYLTKLTKKIMKEY